MTINEYLQGRREIKAARWELRCRELAMRQELVKSLTNENMFGSKVKCYHGDECLGEAFLFGMDNNEELILKKVGEDGTMSYLYTEFRDVDRIERA